METKALRRLERGVGRLTERLRALADKQEQLRAALGKSSEEVERLRREVERYRRERAMTRKKIDELIKRFDNLHLDEDRAGR